MKTIEIFASGIGYLSDHKVEEGTTANDILKCLNLSNHTLNKNLFPYTFASDEQVYDKIEDGQRLYAIGTVHVS